MSQDQKPKPPRYQRRGAKVLVRVPPKIKEGIRILGERNDRNLSQEAFRAFRQWLEKNNALPPVVEPIENPPR